MRWDLLAVLLVIVLLVLLIVLWVQSSRERKTNQSMLLELVKSQAQEKTDLLNRLMSSDLQSYQILKATTNSSETSNTEEPYISHNDVAEAERLQELVGAVGFGQTLLDDESSELQETLGEMGIFANGDRV